MAGSYREGGRPPACRAATGHWHCHAARGDRRPARNPRGRLAGIATTGAASVADVLRALRGDGLVLPGADEVHPRAGAYRATAPRARLRADRVPLLLDVARARSWPLERAGRRRHPTALTSRTCSAEGAPCRPSARPGAEA